MTRKQLIATMPATKTSPRNECLYTPPTGDDPAHLLIDQSGHWSDYWLNEFAADGGRGFHLIKRSASDLASPTEDTFIATDRGNFDSCTCRGFSRFSHCKHVDSIRSIIAAGFLPAPQCRKPVSRMYSPAEITAEFA